MTRVLRSASKKPRETPSRSAAAKVSTPARKMASRTPRRRVQLGAEWDGQKVEDMTINTLRKALKDHAADTRGVKAVLQERLTDLLKSGSKPATPKVHRSTPKPRRTPKGTPRSARKRRNLEEITNLDQTVVSRLTHLGEERFQWDGKDVDKLTVIDLKEVLQVLGLVKTGLKHELHARVLEAFKRCAPTSSKAEQKSAVVKQQRPATSSKAEEESTKPKTAAKATNAKAKEETENLKMAARSAKPEAVEPVKLTAADELNKFTVEELKSMLRERGKKVSGTKAALVQRLVRALSVSKKALSHDTENALPIVLPNSSVVTSTAEVFTSSAPISPSGAPKKSERDVEFTKDAATAKPISSAVVHPARKTGPTAARVEKTAEKTSATSPEVTPAVAVEAESRCSTLFAGPATSPKLPSKSPKMPTRRKTPSHLLQSLKDNIPRPVGTLLSSRTAQSPSEGKVEIAKETSQPEVKSLEPEAAASVATKIAQVVPAEQDGKEMAQAANSAVAGTASEPHADAVVRADVVVEDDDDDGYFTPEEAVEESVDVEQGKADDKLQSQADSVKVKQAVLQEESNQGNSNEILENLVRQIASKGITTEDFEEYDNILKGLVVEDEIPARQEPTTTTEVRLERPTPVRMDSTKGSAFLATKSDHSMAGKRSRQSSTPAGPPKWRQSLLSNMADSTGDASPLLGSGSLYRPSNSNASLPHFYSEMDRHVAETRLHSSSSLVSARPSVSFLAAAERLPHSSKKRRIDTPYYRKPFTPQPRQRDSFIDFGSRAY